MMNTKTIAMCSLLALVACSDEKLRDSDEASDQDNADEAVQAISGTQGDIVATGAGHEADGNVRSGKLYVTPTYQVQGVSIDHTTFFLSTSQSGGTFYREVDGDGVAPNKSTWAQGAESTSFTTSSHGDRLWSVTEVPGRRMVFWVYTSEMK